jgi:hypothetical protein
LHPEKEKGQKQTYEKNPFSEISVLEKQKPYESQRERERERERFF